MRSWPAALPTICSLASNWSDQNHGAAVNGLARPSSEAAAALACSTAFCTDSSRRSICRRLWSIAASEAEAAASRVRKLSWARVTVVTSTPLP